jgi:hypothetical protein
MPMMRTGLHVLERVAVPPPVLKVGVRHGPGRARPGRRVADHHEPPGLAIRQRAQQNGVDETEDGRRRTDAERERHDRGERKARAAPHHANAEAPVLTKHIEVFARRGPEDAGDRAAPQAQPAPAPAAQGGVPLLVLEGRFHLGPEVGAELEGEQGQQGPEEAMRRATLS